MAGGWRLEAGEPFDAQRSSPIGRNHGATPSQVALAWLLQRSPVMLPIPGMSRRAHLDENMEAAGLRLSDEEFEAVYSR